MLTLYLSMLPSQEERSKFEILYLRCRDQMMLTAMSVLHDPHLAEDCVHNAFLAVLEKMDKITDPASPEAKALMVIITKHRAIDMYRKKVREVPWEDFDAVMPVQSEKDHSLTACFLKLPERYRWVLIIHYVHGYTTQEIASALNLTQSGVRKLMSRAKKALKEELSQYE